MQKNDQLLFCFEYGKAYDYKIMTKQREKLLHSRDVRGRLSVNFLMLLYVFVAGTLLLWVLILLILRSFNMSDFHTSPLWLHLTSNFIKLI